MIEAYLERSASLRTYAMHLLLLFGLLSGLTAPLESGELNGKIAVEQRLLEIKLASSLSAYDSTVRKLGDVELQIACVDDAAARESLDAVRERLRKHLRKLQRRSRSAASKIEKLRLAENEMRSAPVARSSEKEKTTENAAKLEHLELTKTRVLDFPAHTLENTGRRLDLAIDGRGFFVVLDSDHKEIGFTRSGKLDIDASGQLVVEVSETMLLLVPPIQIPSNAVEIVFAANGRVSCRLPGEVPLKHLGQIRIAVFEQPESLFQHSENLFAASEKSGKARFLEPGQEASGVILQSFLEISDSDRIRELIEVLTEYLKSTSFENSFRLP